MKDGKGIVIKSIILMIIIALSTTLSFASGIIRFNPPYVLSTEQDGYIEIISLTNGSNSKGEYILIYTTTEGKEGSMHPENINNLNNLITDIEQAKTKRAELTGPVSPPASNKQHMRYVRRESPSNGAYAIIRRDCSNKWGDDYEMVEYCIKNQTAAFNRVSELTGSIVDSCRRKWNNDYEMVEYCTKNQTAAYNRLKGQRGSVAESCRSKWGNDHEMVEYCMEH